MVVKLNNGKVMPMVGLGTWELSDRQTITTALNAAISAGYRHIDTAAFYHNEHLIGEYLNSLLQSSKALPGFENGDINVSIQIKRSDLFITSKLWNDSHDNPETALEESLSKLKLDFLDLYLIHWPVNFNGSFDLEPLWRKMESFVDSGKVKSIGVANFGIKNLTHLLSFCRIKPVVNQIELHPYFPQEEIHSFCKKNNILNISYSTLGSNVAANGVRFTHKIKEQMINRQLNKIHSTFEALDDQSISDGSETAPPPVRDDSLVLQLAEKYSVSASQIILSFEVLEGIAVIPRSSSPEHIQSNINLIFLQNEDKELMRNIKMRFRFHDPKAYGPHRFE
ncbi:unnamed protein product [Medioppia subpectinata]|uniref:NADP-dependent oxidoreductase domain-containing protein n=1 Tax=Medioppia subpectinata TaxID=1979941 RepID=A0A7R9KCA4_9ACAR|nr:unnamed protein product [Medioppia subpectinata]CAG2100816.1 unnamed protein product [Medioppia subpectinata]